MEILLLADVSPDAVPGNILNLTINAADVLLPPGSVDSVSPVNFPAATGERTIIAGARPILRSPWTSRLVAPDGVWRQGEYLLGPNNARALLRPAGNRVPGYIVVENNGTDLFVAVDAFLDAAVDPGDGLALVFDTDRDGVPTPGADDAFVANVTGAEHFRFNATSGNWTAFATCTQLTAPGCGIGFGTTPLAPIAHRFYEFAIPLATLGLAAGDLVHFALAGELPAGVRDAGGRSTWPLLFGTTMPSLAHSGALLLSPGPLPNRGPSLDWTGDPGYETDGVDPDTGPDGLSFRFQVLYTDPDDDPPSIVDPRLHVLENGTDVGGSPFSMISVDPGGEIYIVGAAYDFDLVLPCGGNYSYFVSAEDARGLPANDTPVLAGPRIVCPDRVPVLGEESVSPFVGTAQQTTFTYRVKYADPEGEPPSAIEAFIVQNGTVIASPALNFTGWVGANGSYAAGARYAASVPALDEGTNYSYWFRAADRNNTVATDPILGPYVRPQPPDTVTLTSANLAPLFIDEGSRDTRFLGLSLYPSGDVVVTELRVDQFGTAPDAEVPAVHLWHDRDENRIRSPGDEELGAQQPLGGVMRFSLSLEVRPPGTSLLLLVDVRGDATADATIGLEVRDASYVTVSAEDEVAPFFNYRSDRAVINVAPAAEDVAVDGHPGGSPGILHITADEPQVAWRFADENGADVTQKAVNASVSAGPTLLWFLNETGAANSEPYAGPALLDGGTYVLAVAVSDGRLWSPPTSVFFRMNTPPPAPTLLAPLDLAVAVDPNATLAWSAVTDVDDDAITYTYWISENPGFSPVVTGSTPSPGALVELQPDTTYYWKVGASDGYAFAGNATIWRFTTAGGSPNVMVGEIRGRAVHGSAPLPDVLVELFFGADLVAQQTTSSDPANRGNFSFRGLAVRAYTVRFSAYGFRPETRAAEPTAALPIVDLGDVLMTRVGESPDEREWTVWGLPLVPLVLLVAVALLLALFSLGAVLRRRRGAEDEAESQPEGVEPKSPVPMPEGAMLFECPSCGRRVAADALTCECGVEFEA